MHLNAHVPDLRAFLDDPVHEVQLAGTIYVDGLTQQPVRVDAASLHLMVPTAGGPQRTMDYAVPFTDDAGTEWLLQGSKQIERRWLNGPWYATTVLFFVIVPPESRYESLAPTGRAVISPAGVFRLLGSLRATGTERRSEAARTVTRFGTFFAQSVLRAYWPSGGPRSARGGPQ
jgi:cholesterol oxidase